MADPKKSPSTDPWEQEAASMAAMPEHKISAAPKTFSGPWFKEKLYNGVDKGSNALPAVGGIAGGAIGAGGGPVTAVGGAALGGAAGESARQLVRRVSGFEDAPQTSGDAALGIGKEALKQGAYEAGGRLAQGAARGMAPRIAEAAVAPGKRLLKSVPESVDIGKTILSESKGYKPSTIANELEAKIAGHSQAADSVLDAAGQNGVKVSLTPARKQVAEESVIAKAKNSPSYIKDVEKVRDQLAFEHGPDGKPMMNTVTSSKPGAGFVPTPVQSTTKVPVGVPDMVDPLRARQIRQGVDMEIGNWNPEAQASIAPLQRRVYGAVTGEIHNAVPEVAQHDADMTSLIPAKQAAWNTSFNPGLTKTVFDRFARPTGALVGGVAGAEAGRREGGTPGAIVGGLAGLTLPLAISSPTGMMLAARTLNSRGLQGGIAAGRFAAPVVEGQMGRPSPEDDEDKNRARN